MEQPDSPRICSEPGDRAAEPPGEPEPFVVFEWVVPRAAKVAGSRAHPALRADLVRPAAVSSTVPAALITELRANNTVCPAPWCTTATLTAARRAR